MDELLLNTVLDKVEAQERKLAELNDKSQDLSTYNENLQEVKKEINDLRSDVQKIKFPDIEMLELSATLQNNITILKKPVKQQVVHEHHIPKLTWIVAGLFLVLSITLAALYTTKNNLNEYKARDTKYRYIKLEANKNLHGYLQFVDSLYLTNPKMRQDVIAREEQNRKNFELMEKAAALEREAKELKGKVEK